MPNVTAAELAAGIPGVERLRTLVVVARDAAGNETTFRR